MKIVHTSDWHLGRRWKGIRRLDEMETVLDNLAGFVEEEKVDLVIHSGDVFDRRNPPPDAEQLANRFFVRVSRSGARTVVIAGNHDDPDRFDAQALFAEYANVDILGRPRRARNGGVRAIETRSGEVALVAALPFASPGAWISALDLADDEAEARSKYARMFQSAVAQLTAGFGGDTVNVLVAHTHLESAVFGSSERRVHIGDDWAATAQTLPATAQYIALGHIHMPQRVEGVLPAYYAGSPLQMDFGEIGQEKSFVVVEASPGRPARIEHVPYEGGIPLREVRATLDELETDADNFRLGHLRVTVPLTEPDPDINRKVRALLPNALVVQIELPDRDEQRDDEVPPGATPEEHYAVYFRHRNNGQAPSERLAEAFRTLHAAAASAED